VLKQWELYAMKGLTTLLESLKTYSPIISLSAALVSALAASVSAYMAFNIFSVHQQGRRELELSERPRISIKDQTLEPPHFFKDPPMAIFTLKFEFKKYWQTSSR
jgi:hypothetical protein